MEIHAVAVSFSSHLSSHLDNQTTCLLLQPEEGAQSLATMAAKAARHERNHGSRWRRLKVDGGGLGGFGGFLVIGGALVAAAAFGAGFTARAFGKKKRPEIDEEDLISIGNIEGDVKFEEEQKGQESFGLENRCPPSPQALEFPPPPPTPSLASSEDDNGRYE